VLRRKINLEREIEAEKKRYEKKEHGWVCMGK
jgi:hypothetical protein